MTIFGSLIARSWPRNIVIFLHDSETSSSSVSVPPFFFASNSRNRSFSRTTFSAASKYSKYSTYPFSSLFPHLPLSPASSSTLAFRAPSRHHRARASSRSSLSPALSGTKTSNAKDSNSPFQNHHLSQQQSEMKVSSIAVLFSSSSWI